MTKNSSSDGDIKIPPELLPILSNFPQNGEELISLTREIMYYLGDYLATENFEILLPFQAIDSETDHIQLNSNYSFNFPSPRVSLSGTHLSGRLVNSSMRSVIRPNDKEYDEEIVEIYRLYGRTYLDAIIDLMKHTSVSRDTLPYTP